VQVLKIAHVQLAMPLGGEERARAFYERLLEIPEVAKPGKLALRGGIWFERGTLKIHLAADHGFRPTQKAHPALAVQDLPELSKRLREAGFPVIEDEPIAGTLRTYVYDPFGNRLELIEELS